MISARSKIEVSLKSLLGATDFSLASENALRYGRTLGPYKGGIRFHPAIDNDEGRALPKGDFMFAQVASVDTFSTTLGKTLNLGLPFCASAPPVPADHILKAATECSADLLVMGSAWKGCHLSSLNLSLGSTAYWVVSESPCPVLTVQE